MLVWVLSIAVASVTGAVCGILSAKNHHRQALLTAVIVSYIVSGALMADSLKKPVADCRCKGPVECPCCQCKDLIKE